MKKPYYLPSYLPSLSQTDLINLHCDSSTELEIARLNNEKERHNELSQILGLISKELNARDNDA